MSEPQWSPIACRMDALSAEERRRRSEVLALLRERLRGISETEDGVVFQLPAATDLPALAGEFMAFESRCCPFIRFELTVEAEGGAVQLRLGGRAGVKEFLLAEFLRGQAQQLALGSGQEET